MFYSETLLSKTGPLAHVWLSANIERKLSKTQIVQSSVQQSVDAIVNEGQAPLALRLSGQLLLGIARIYRRKARYLLDDCNEAILKIKMAFRSGNVDLPANQSHTANPASLTLPDVLTEIDLLGPAPDPSLLLSQNLDDGLLNDNSLFDLSNTQLSIERGRAASEQSEIEVGRRAHPSEALGDELDETTKLYDDDLGLDIGEPVPTGGRDSTMILGMNDTNKLLPDADITSGQFDDNDGFRIGDDDTELPPLDNAFGDPLAEDGHRLSVEHDSNRSVRESSMIDAHEESAHQAQQRVKRRKVLQIDSDTQIPSHQIRAQQNDRSKILKPTSLLAQDPMLLALIELQKNGGFVSSILGDGRSKGWAPELRGILSLEVVQGSRKLKRKRDTTGGELQPSDASAEQGRLGVDGTLNDDANQIEGDTTMPAGDMLDEMNADGMGIGGDETVHLQSRPGTQEPVDHFDHTEMPLLHPSESGPVSLGTKHVVHMLREKFGAAAAQSPSKRQSSSVLFQDLLPERTTTKADATKMFFEVLVLATKDAIKVSQDEDHLGGPLHVRGKRGLWGAWAEMEAGGEIAHQEEPVAA